MSLEKTILDSEGYIESYRIWRNFANSHDEQLNDAFHDPSKDFGRLLHETELVLYKQALNILKDVSLPYNLCSLGSELRPIEQHSNAGLFVSAAFAISKLPILYIPQIFPCVSGIGYCLPSEKTIVNNAPLKDLGKFSSGTIVNKGENKKMIFAYHTSDGLYMNLGTVGEMSKYSKSGVHINHGKAWSFAETIGVGLQEPFQKGLYVNFGKVHEFADNACSDVFINHGDVCHFASNASGGLQIAYILPAIGTMKEREVWSFGPDRLGEESITGYMQPLNDILKEKDYEVLKKKLLERFGTASGEEIAMDIMRNIAAIEMRKFASTADFSDLATFDHPLFQFALNLPDSE